MVLCFAAFVAIFIRVSGWEQEQSLLEFRMRSQELADSIKARLEEQSLFLEQLSSTFATRRMPVTRQNFRDLVQKLVRRFPSMRRAGPPVYRSPGSTLRGLESLPLYLE